MHPRLIPVLTTSWPVFLQGCKDVEINPSKKNEGGIGIIVRCPHGCKTRLSGCDIKGDISLDSGEKTYHLPSQKHYKERVIRTQYGERWFCAELDAIARGWKKAEN